MDSFESNGRIVLEQLLISNDIKNQPINEEKRT